MPISGRSFPSHHVYIRNAQVVVQQGQTQALAGTIACNLQFSYDANAIPNDTSPLTITHTLQGSVILNLIFTPNSGGILNDSSNLNVAHILQGNIIDLLIFTYTSGGQLLDSSNLNVAHTATSNIVTQVNITGGSNLAITTQSSVACLAVLSAQLAVAHTLQGNIIDALIFSPFGGVLNDTSNLNVAHTLLSSIDINSSFTGNNNLNEASQTGIADVNVFSGFLNVNHTLTGPVITILGFSDSFAVAHTLDNGGINGSSGFTDRFFTVAHTLQGNITTSLGITGDFPSNNLILINGGVVGNLGVDHTLQSIVIGSCGVSGNGNTQHSLDNGGINDVTTIMVSDLALSHTLQGSITDVLNITGDLNVSHTLQGILDCYCDLDQASGILCDVEITGTLTLTRSLSGSINCSTGITAGLGGASGGGGTIGNVGTITGDLGVNHTLESLVVESSQLTGNGNTQHSLDNGGISLISTITTMDLGVNHTLVSNIILLEGGAGNVVTGNNATIVIVSIITGSLTNAVALQGTIVNSCVIIPITVLTQNGSTLIPAGCVVIGQLNIARSLNSMVTANLILQGTITAGAPLFAFPGDFVVTTAEIRLLIVPTRKTLFGNFKRIIRLFVLAKPKKL